MIFLRQKQFNTPRIVNGHRERSRSHLQRHLRHQQIVRQNAIDLNSNRSRQRNLTRSQNDEVRRSIALNERLASIGGLFGAINIIITGALLYSIFTAKPEDKWWYICGVIINISILIVLMISAILFDRYYLKRLNNISRNSSASLTNNRIVNTNPSLLPYPESSPNFPADVPPLYPEYLNESNPVKIEYETGFNSRLISTSITDTHNSYNNSGDPIQIDEISEIKINNDCNEDQTGKYQSPPNYFDLYPKQLTTESCNNTPSTSTSLTIITNTNDQTSN